MFPCLLTFIYKTASQYSGKESDSCGVVMLNLGKSNVNEMSKSGFCEPVEFSMNAYNNMLVTLLCLLSVDPLFAIQRG